MVGWHLSPYRRFIMACIKRMARLFAFCLGFDPCCKEYRDGSKGIGEGGGFRDRGSVGDGEGESLLGGFAITMNAAMS